MCYASEGVDQKQSKSKNRREKFPYNDPGYFLKIGKSIPRLGRSTSIEDFYENFKIPNEEVGNIIKGKINALRGKLNKNPFIIFFPITETIYAN